MSQHPEIEPTGIDFLTNEAIQSIKLSDKGLCEYAARFSEKGKLSSKRDVESVAYTVYHAKSKSILSRLMDRRNALLSNYLLNVKGLSSEQVSVSKMDETSLEAYKKASRYELHVVTYEEVESD